MTVLNLNSLYRSNFNPRFLKIFRNQPIVQSVDIPVALIHQEREKSEEYLDRNIRYSLIIYVTIFCLLYFPICKLL